MIKMSDKFAENLQYDSEVASPMDDMSRTGYGRGYQQGRQDALYDLWNRIIGKYDVIVSLEELAVDLEEVKNG